MTALTPKEQDQQRGLQQCVIDTERKAARLQTMIDEFAKELKALEQFNFRKFADEPNPFFAHRAAVTATEGRRRELRNFIEDMPPVVAMIEAEATDYKTRMNEIETKAQVRANLIKSLEEEVAIAGDLPKDKREQLTRLKGEVAGIV